MSRRSKGKISYNAGRAARSGAIAGQTGQAQNRWLSSAACLILVLAVWAVFGQTLHYDFVNYDDDSGVYENPAIARGLSWSGIIWAFTHSLNDNWLPVTALSHMLDCQLFGLNPAGHHLTNVLIHIATVIALFLVLRGMTGALWRSAFVAAVFAIHPLRVQSVAWVAERKDVLSGLFFMLTIGAYVHYVRRPRSPVRYGLVLLLFVLGLMSKPMLVTLPFVLLLLDYWPLQRKEPARNMMMEKLPLLALSAVVCVVTILAQGEAIQSALHFDLPTRIGNALVAYASYLGQMVYPVGLAVLYPHPGKNLSVWTVGLSVLVLFIITMGVMAGRRKHPYLLMGWLWYLGMLVPVIGLMQVGSQARADRYTYLPQIGLYILVAWGMAELCDGVRWRRVALGFVAAAILAGLLVDAYVQTTYWKNSFALWTHDLACAPENNVAHNNLGKALADQGKLADAISHYERALQLQPDYAQAHNNLGLALAREGRSAEAIPHYERAVQLQPDYAQAYNNLGAALASQGKPAEAVEQYERAAQLQPDETQVHDNLGLALASQGKLADAISQYERALELQPDYVQAHNNLGLALAGQGKLTEAIPHYERALQLQPDYAQARNNLGLALASQGKLVDAISQYERALQLQPDLVEAHNNLANALASQGKLTDAISQYEQALKLQPDLVEARNNLGNALAGQGKLAEAIEQYERALQFNPDFVEGHYDLGNALVRQGNLVEAIPHYERALELRPDYIEAHYNLGLALAGQGRLPEAILHFQQALSLATAQNQTSKAETIRNQIKSYQSDLPQNQTQ